MEGKQVLGLEIHFVWVLQDVPVLNTSLVRASIGVRTSVIKEGLPNRTESIVPGHSLGETGTESTKSCE